MVTATMSPVFSFATPLRVSDLLALAIIQALGPRAPRDKRERGLRTTLAGLRAGEFVVDIDGRIFRDPSEVVVCSGSAILRFFSSEARRAANPH
jgi:hypothetical protein